MHLATLRTWCSINHSGQVGFYKVWTVQFEHLHNISITHDATILLPNWLKVQHIPFIPIPPTIHRNCTLEGRPLGKDRFLSSTLAALNKLQQEYAEFNHTMMIALNDNYCVLLSWSWKKCIIGSVGDPWWMFLMVCYVERENFGVDISIGLRWSYIMSWFSYQLVNHEPLTILTHSWQMEPKEAVYYWYLTFIKIGPY